MSLRLKGLNGDEVINHLHNSQLTPCHTHHNKTEGPRQKYASELCPLSEYRSCLTLPPQHQMPGKKKMYLWT